jgi:hypothetical protein
LLSTIVILLGAILKPASAQQAACPFDIDRMSFSGSPTEQALCLLRPVLRYAHLGTAEAALPEPLHSLVGRSIDITPERMAAFLAERGVRESDIGGPLGFGVSSAGTTRARYFVIHDTSSPNYKEKPFPANLNEPSWSDRQMSVYRNATKKAAHVFISRTGASLTQVDFGTPWRATKFELRSSVGTRLKGLFLHVENLQPRRSDPQGGSGNDAIAPEPGFTDVQLRRLAVVYVAASIRAGTWLVPVYHAVLDNGISGGHDDPQNFDLQSWARHLAETIAKVR